MGRGAEGCWGKSDFPVIATGSLFTCLQGSQPFEWALLLGLVSEDRVLWNFAPDWPSPYSIRHGTFYPSVWFKPSPGTLQLACKNSNWKGCFKWSLLLLYKPSFKIDYKMFLNLPNTLESSLAPPILHPIVSPFKLCSEADHCSLPPSLLPLPNHHHPSPVWLPRLDNCFWLCLLQPLLSTLVGAITSCASHIISLCLGIKDKASLQATGSHTVPRVTLSCSLCSEHPALLTGPPTCQAPLSSGALALAVPSAC